MSRTKPTAVRQPWTPPSWTGPAVFVRRFVALVVVVITINLCWQYFRVWMPKMLREQYAYTDRAVQSFSVAYYIAADVGCHHRRPPGEMAGRARLYGPPCAADDVLRMCASDRTERARRVATGLLGRFSAFCS